MQGILFHTSILWSQRWGGTNLYSPKMGHKGRCPSLKMETNGVTLLLVIMSRVKLTKLGWGNRSRLGYACRNEEAINWHVFYLKFSFMAFCKKSQTYPIVRRNVVACHNRLNILAHGQRCLQKTGVIHCRSVPIHFQVELRQKKVFAWLHFIMSWTV